MAEQDYRSMVEQAQRLAAQGAAGDRPGVMQSLMTGDFPSARTGMRQALFGDPNATVPFAVGGSMGEPEMQPMIQAGNQLAGAAMTGGPPMATRGALGMAGGKMLAGAKVPTYAEMDVQLEKALKGSGVVPMDMAGKWGMENAPQAAKDIWAKREALAGHVDKIDEQLKAILGEEKYFDVVGGFGPASARQVSDKKAKELLVERQRIVGE